MTTALLVVVTAFFTALVMRWRRSPPPFIRALTAEAKEAGRAKAVGDQLDGARDRASAVETERNRLALTKAVKAALWVTEARLNAAVPELLKMAQLWAAKSSVRREKWTAPKGVPDIDGLDDPAAPWASWSFDGHHCESKLGGSLRLCPRRSKATSARSRFCSTGSPCST